MNDTAAATIYLDYAATTPLDPRVAAIMHECLIDPRAQANAASATHGPGFAALELVESGRSAVAGLLGAAPAEIIFTSGATESNNLALLGAARAARRAGAPAHIVSARTEHKSVLDACRQLQKEGFAVTLVEPGPDGRVAPGAVESALRADTLLVSIMLANNELGVVNDLAAIGSACRARQVLLHTDASQAAGKVAVNVDALRVDLLSLTAHKLYGPKGVGALYVREAARPKMGPIMWGGGHERGLRPGTLPTHQVVGFGAAAQIARDEFAAEAEHVGALRDCLWSKLRPVAGVLLNTAPGPALPGVLNVSFEGVEGESLITALAGLAVSSGSACSSASREPSYVLRALGRDTELAQSSLRLSFGRFTTAAQVERAAAVISREVGRLRSLAYGGEPPELPGAPDAPSAESGLLERALTPLARRYFRAAPRPPRFAAIQPLPDGVRQGRAGSAADGTAVMFEAQIDAGFVKDARFTVYGCPHTVAVVAWLCETLRGLPAEAGAVGTPTDWARRFEVPAEKLGRLLIVEDALRAVFPASDRAR